MNDELFSRVQEKIRRTVAIAGSDSLLELMMLLACRRVGNQFVIERATSTIQLFDRERSRREIRKSLMVLRDDHRVGWDGRHNDLWLDTALLEKAEDIYKALGASGFEPFGLDLQPSPSFALLMNGERICSLVGKKPISVRQICERYTATFGQTDPHYFKESMDRHFGIGECVLAMLKLGFFTKTAKSDTLIPVDTSGFHIRQLKKLLEPQLELVSDASDIDDLVRQIRGEAPKRTRRPAV